MLLSNDDSADSQGFHPFWYARVLGIYHLNVRDHRAEGTEWKRVELLWVRWFAPDFDVAAGWDARRLDQVGYIPSDEEGAFGFLDPAHVLRGAHLIPFFDGGKTDELLVPTSVAADSSEGDWERYCVNR